MIVIGDVHGNYDALIRLIDKLPDDKICFSGDMIDRGPKSRQVLEYIIEAGHDAVQGNHEYMFYQGSYNSSIKHMWLQHGGRECRDSYGDRGDIFYNHQRWAHALPLYKEYKDCVDEAGNYLIVSHTGLVDIWHLRHLKGPGNMFAYSCLWENDFREMSKYDGKYNFYNIFGHSPCNYSPSIFGSYACIDGGGYIKERAFNRLTAIQYPSMEIFEEKVDKSI